MTDPTTKVRLDKFIGALHVSAKIAIGTDRRRFGEQLSDRYDRLTEAALEYEKYLLTLDPSTLSSLLDLSEDIGNVFITTPVKIDNEAVKCVNLSYLGSSLLCGPPETANTDPLLRVPDGKYRFVLIAIPEAE
jgi:hypothetical protein